MRSHLHVVRVFIRSIGSVALGSRRLCMACLAANSVDWVVERSETGPEVIRIVKRLAGVVILLALMATTCGDAERDTFACFDIGGEQICDETSSSSQINFLIDTDQPDNFVLRFHPEDAELYSLREANPLSSHPISGIVTAEIERLEPGPISVCLRNNAYLENISEQDRALVFKAGECTELRLGRTAVEPAWGRPPM